MANADYSAIKAGVNGVVDDAPGPSMEQAESPQEGPVTEIMQPQEEAQPSYQTANQPYPQATTSDDSSRIQEIAEAIINEKWQELLSSVGNIAVWKEDRKSVV